MKNDFLFMLYLIFKKKKEVHYTQSMVIVNGYCNG